MPKHSAIVQSEAGAWVVLSLTLFVVPMCQIGWAISINGKVI